MADGSVAITAGTGTPIRVLTGLGASGADQQVVTLADSAGNLLGTSSAGLPTVLVGASGLATTSGTLSAAATNTPGTAVTASSTGQVVTATALAGNVTFHLVSAAFVGTVVFEASVDAGLNYAPIMAIREDGSGAETTAVLSVASAFIRLYTAALPGLAYFRVRCSAFTSGTLAVILAPGPTLIEPNPSLASGVNYIGQVRLTDGTNAPAVKALATTAATSTDPALLVQALPTVSQTSSILGSAATAVTLTLAAPGAGLRHYITGIWFERYVSVATTAAASGFVSTSANSGLVFQLPSDAQAIGTVTFPVAITFSSPVAATTQNTATTFTAPAVTGTQYRISVTYFTAP